MNRILFVTDIHGSDKLFYKMLNGCKIYNANIIIVGGDIAGKTLIPIFLNNGKYIMNVEGQEKTIESKEELDHIVKDASFERLIEENISGWCKLAEERLKPLSARLIMNTGNDDPVQLGSIIESSGFVEYPNEKVIELDQHHELLSLGYSNITPWKLPGDLSEEELGNRIDKLVSYTRDVKNALFNIHVPPFNTHLDLAPKLDEQLRPKLSPGGEPEFVHVGSSAVRDAIERYQPLAGLHGHIHESRGYTKIGRTHCFNPGSEYSIGVLKGLLLNLSQEKIESHIFTSG